MKVLPIKDVDNKLWQIFVALYMYMKENSVVVFVIFYIILALMVWKKTHGRCFISPIFWLIFSWIGLFGLYFFSGIKYNNPLKFSGILYLLSQLVFFIICYRLGYSSKFKQRRFLMMHQGDSLEAIPIKTYFYISSIAVFVWIVDVFRSNNIVFGYRIENFSISVIGVIADLFVSLSLLVWIFSLYKAIKTNERIPYYSYLSAVIYLVPSFVTSGRQPITILLISTVICLIYAKINKYRYFSFFVKIGATLLGAIVVYLLFISLTRDIGSSITDKIALTELTSNCKVTKECVDFLNLFGPLKAVVLDFEVYYSHQLSGFQIFFDHWNGPLFWGSVEFGYISRRFPVEWGFNKEAAYEYLEVIAKSTGTYAHIWRTTFGEYIMDFGYIGAYIFFGAMGYLAGSRRRMLNYFDNVYNFALLVLLCVFGFFSIQASAWAETTWAYPFFWIYVLSVIDLKNVRWR